METFIKDIKVKLKQENPKPKENNNLVPPKPNNPQNNSSPKIDLNLIPPKPNNQPSMENNEDKKKQESPKTQIPNDLIPPKPNNPPLDSPQTNNEISQTPTIKVNVLISPQIQEAYNRIKDQLSSFKNQFQNVNNTQMVSIIRQCFNSLGATQNRVREKYQILTRLIKEDNEQAKNYALMNIAEIFIQQAEVQVMSQPKSAFSYCYLIVFLMAKYPALKDFVLGFFYEKCPYTVPLLPKLVSGNAQEFKIVCLKYKSGVNGLESEENYINRMSGYICLYASLTVINVNGLINPFGIENAWGWLARVLNFQPVDPFVRLILTPFMKQTSYFLKLKYRNHYMKLVKYMEDNLLEGGSFQSKTVLRKEINDTKEQNMIMPEGYDLPEATTEISDYQGGDDEDY